MKIEHGVNEKGEPTITCTVAFPSASELNEFDFPALVQRCVEAAYKARIEAFAAKLKQVIEADIDRLQELTEDGC